MIQEKDKSSILNYLIHNSDVQSTKSTYRKKSLIDKENRENDLIKQDKILQKCVSLREIPSQPKSNESKPFIDKSNTISSSNLLNQKKTHHMNILSDSSTKSKSGINIEDNNCEDELKNKLNNLQKNLCSQGKMLKTLHKKILSEKSEINEMADTLFLKSKKTNKMRSPSEKIDSVNKKTKKYASAMNDKFLDRKFSDTTGLTFDSKDNPDNSRNLCISECKSIKTSRTKIKFDNTDEISKPKVDHNPLWIHEEKDQNNGQESQKIHELNSYIKTLVIRHEEELECLKTQIREIKEENTRLKQRNSNEIPRKTPTPDKLLPRESHCARRLFELQEALVKKDIEFESKELDYKNRIEELTNIINNLSIQNKKIPELEYMIDEYKKKLNENLEDVKAVKKLYMDKLQEKIEDQIIQKKEWSMIYNQLFHEIKILKEEIDLLCYKNKRLMTTLNHCKNINKSELNQ